MVEDSVSVREGIGSVLEDRIQEVSRDIEDHLHSSVVWKKLSYLI
jgi:hypothetical protein